MAIVFTDKSLYPRNEYGAIIPFYKSFWEASSKLSMFLSLISAALGMAKFILNGPIRILPTNYPLSGLVSPHFAIAFFIHMMFGFRTVCIENSFFTTYQEDKWNATNYSYDRKRIDPIFDPKYRMLAYFVPVIITITIGAAKAISSSKGVRGMNLVLYPQFLMGCGFSPIMYEGYEVRTKEDGKKTYGYRIWKIGTIVNALFLGLVPQFVLLGMDHYRGVPSWGFQTAELDQQEEKKLSEGNDALFKSQLGNTLFSSITILLFLVFNVPFFYWLFYRIDYLDQEHTFIPSSSKTEPSNEEKNIKVSFIITCINLLLDFQIINKMFISIDLPYGSITFI